MVLEEELCIISGDNRSWENNNIPNTVIELWCRSKKGHSVLLLVNGLRPYLEIFDPNTNSDSTKPTISLEVIEELKEIYGPPVRIENKLFEGKMKPFWRIYIKDTRYVRNVREKLMKMGWGVTSADILFVQRLLLDCDLGPHIKVTGDILWAGERAPSNTKNQENTDKIMAESKIKNIGGAGIYPVDMVISCSFNDLERSNPFATPFVTFSFDLETSIATNQILCAAAVIERNKKRKEYTFRGDESSIMEGLTTLIRNEDPDIITGYNIDNFDLPRMDERAALLSKKVKMKAALLNGWGRVPLVDSEYKRLMPTRKQNRVWRIPGRIPLDAWWQARQTLRPQRESLQYVSQLLWPDDEGMHKLDIDSSQMDKECAERPDEVMKYCVRDTIIPIDILNKLQSIGRKEALASVAMTTLDIAATATTSWWIDSLVIRLADRSNIAVPMTKSGPRRKNQIAGGYVHEVEAGMRPWITVLDFKSMYPSIMISKNICSTTLVRSDKENSNSDNISPVTDTRYVSSDIRKGLVPQLLEHLMASRDFHKKAFTKASESGNEEQAFLQDQLQYAVKILMNSFYGVFASSFYRFTDPKLGASITEWARFNIKEIIRQLEEEGKDVVYSDTDSIFVRAPVVSNAPTSKPEIGDPTLKSWEEAKKITLDFGEKLALRFSKEGAELEFETALSAFFSHGAKKRYVGRVIWPREELLIRGYEVRRTDSFELLRETMTKMFELILDNESWASVEMTKNVIDDVKAKRVKPSKLIISRSCKGRWDNKKGKWVFDMYSNENLPYIRAAKERIKRGLTFTPGMKVGYIVTDASSSPMNVEPWLVDEIGAEPPDYDSAYYAARLAKALGRITEAFNWNEKELLSGSRQQTLFDF
jgi:DNA polymerase I